MTLETAEYVFVGACGWIALLALWKGDALLGLGVFGVALLVYWIMVQHLSMAWLE